MRSSPYTVVSIHMPTIILVVTVGQPTQRKFYFARASLWRGPHLPWYVIKYCEVRGSNPTDILSPHLSVDIQTKEHIISLHWRHNDHDSVSNHQPHGCLLNRLFRRKSKKTSKLCVTGLCVGIHRDRWIPRTKGQLRGKCFHLMTSSYSVMQWKVWQNH